MPVTDDVREACLAYIGRKRSQHDTMAPEPANRLAVILRTECPDQLPTTWHWAYFTTALCHEDTGHDGHERLGLFLPPVPFSRRMWAAGSIAIHRQLQFCVPADRVSTVTNVSFKEGRTGPLCFVEIEHEISQSGDVCLREVQIVVYRDRGLADEPSAPTRTIPEGFRAFCDTELIAYSSVLQNGHRIHWDRDFCRDVEGYPGLVVHGPLLATLLAEELCDLTTSHKFSFRAMAPVFEDVPVRVTRHGETAALIRQDGVVAMEGRYEKI